MGLKKWLESFKTVNNNVLLYGDFGMRVYQHGPEGPECVLRFQKRNQITNEAREALLTLLVPAGATDQEQNQIWSFGIGTDATPPTVLDTDATMDPTIVWRSNLVGAEKSTVILPPNSFYVAISKTLGTGDANGSTIAEAGIFTQGDISGGDDPTTSTGKKLYARQIFTAIPKTSTMSIQFDWRLGINIQA